jgi:hypothetical protein
LVADVDAAVEGDDDEQPAAAGWASAPTAIAPAVQRNLLRVMVRVMAASLGQGR